MIIHTEGMIEFEVDESFTGCVAISNLQMRAEGTEPGDAGYLGHVGVEDLLVFLKHYQRSKPREFDREFNR